MGSRPKGAIGPIEEPDWRGGNGKRTDAHAGLADAPSISRKMS